jgi:E3 ubiquitin-protein ligase HERC2
MSSIERKISLPLDFVGGLFRDSISAFCEDLQSGYVPLLIQCPNARLGYGNNQDKFIPSPTALSSLHLSMFAFLGKLMGMAVRGHHVLNLDLPSVVWKPLVGDPISKDDITVRHSV